MRIAVGRARATIRVGGEFTVNGLRSDHNSRITGPARRAVCAVVQCRRRPVGEDLMKGVSKEIILLHTVNDSPIPGRESSDTRRITETCVGVTKNLRESRKLRADSSRTRGRLVARSSLLAQPYDLSEQSWCSSLAIRSRNWAKDWHSEREGTKRETRKPKYSWKREYM